MMSDPRDQPLFAELSDNELGNMRQLSTQELLVEAGESLAVSGDLTENFYLLLAGELQVTRRIGGQKTVVSAQRDTLQGDRTPGRQPRSERPDPTVAHLDSQRPILLATPRFAAVEAVTSSRLLVVPADAYLEWVSGLSPANRIIVSALVQRVQLAEIRLLQQDKLSALGKMAAGLAHDLNNPAAAACRAADQLSDILLDMQAGVSSLLRQRLTLEQSEELDAVRQELQTLAAETYHNQRTSPQSPFAQAVREEEIAVWLEARGVAEGWRLAPSLAESGVSTTWLETVAERISPEALSGALTWLEASLAADRITDEIVVSTRRISDLVSAVKAYVYMDRTPMQEIDIHEGIENTLTILSHRLKNVNVVRNFDRTLPRVWAYAGELNQVWTNLLDNAVDALHGQGQIRVSTSRQDNWLIVEIADNGSGIPPEILPRIFEPFFTTKSVSKGLGLGLDITYRIITGRHHGDIRVHSVPGDTRFQVYLPIS